MEGSSVEGGVGASACLQPSLVLLVVTLLVTATATTLLCVSVLSHHWERVTWDRARVHAIAASNLTNNRKISLDWFLDGVVGRVSVQSLLRPSEQPSSVFLVPMHAGIWTLCVDLTDEDARLMKTVGFPETPCINYLTPNIPVRTTEEPRTDWQHRMQNLSISCSLVCLIILGSSALVGAFGIIKHQISAVLVTGVMYLLAATFALFTLTIIHFKRTRLAEYRNSGSTGGGGGPKLAEGVIPDSETSCTTVWHEFYSARIFSTGWSLELGWAAAGACVLASALWILLAKVMRYNPISNILT